MLNYYSRTIEPIVSAITDELKRKFLTKTARTQGQTIMSFRDPFKLVPVKELAELADKFTRNEIMSSNEIRQVIGIKPSDDPKADQLVNSNLNQSNQNIQETYGNQNLENGDLNNIEKPEESDKTKEQDETIEDIYNTLSVKQKDAVDALIDSILADYGIQPEDE
jgi:DNA-directed RNA polymerase beta' subunit